MNAKEQLYQSQVGRRKEKDTNAKRIATSGENMAARFLEESGYVILAANFRAGRAGEIDLVARGENDILVFVEVKTRTIDGVIYGIPELGFESVGYRKQRKILDVSTAYMKKFGLCGRRWRYDVIVIYICRRADLPPTITHVEDAFR